jgi:hypothetical protein
MSYFKGLIDHYNKDTHNKIKATSRSTVPLPIFIKYNNTRKEKMMEMKQNNTDEIVIMYENT